MATSRYDGRRFINIDNDLWRHEIEKRGLKFIKVHNIANLQYPTAKQISKLTLRSHIWKSGDSLTELANDHYGDPKLWWIVSWFNKKPTEGLISVGSVLYIPHPLERILDLLGI